MRKAPRTSNSPPVPSHSSRPVSTWTITCSTPRRDRPKLRRSYSGSTIERHRACAERRSRRAMSDGGSDNEWVGRTGCALLQRFGDAAGQVDQLAGKTLPARRASHDVDLVAR